MDEKDILSLTKAELSQALKRLDLPAYRAGQIWSWLQIKNAASFDDMTDLPKALRRTLSDNFVIFDASIEKRSVSVYDDTVKYLFRMHDGEYVESVVMKYKYGYSVCVSTEIGCNMGCRFCASAIGGMVRRLEPSEMLSQVYAAERDRGIRVSHVVLMGMGEPMDNYDNVIRFIRLLTDPEGHDLSVRHVSLSTSGVVPGIEKLMKEDLPLTLSVSLHAPNDDIRGGLMPVDHRWGVDELLAACRKYASATSRRISFEYAMIAGVNDSEQCAAELARRLKGMLCHVNLIPVNEVPGTSCRRSSDAVTAGFARILEDSGITVTVRRRLGSDINASCGQLRRTHIQDGDKK